MYTVGEKYPQYDVGLRRARCADSFQNKRLSQYQISRSRSSCVRSESPDESNDLPRAIHVRKFCARASMPAALASVTAPSNSWRPAWIAEVGSSPNTESTKPFASASHSACVPAYEACVTQRPMATIATTVERLAEAIILPPPDVASAISSRMLARTRVERRALPCPWSGSAPPW